QLWVVPPAAPLPVPWLADGAVDAEGSGLAAMTAETPPIASRPAVSASVAIARRAPPSRIPAAAGARGGDASWTAWSSRTGLCCSITGASLAQYAAPVDADLPRRVVGEPSMLLRDSTGA